LNIAFANAGASETSQTLLSGFIILNTVQLIASDMNTFFLWLVVLTCASFSYGAEVKTRDAAVRDDRAAVGSGWRWIYNDYQRGVAEAKRTGKPLLVVLCCVRSPAPALAHPAVPFFR
jgi:hypothetical protein